MGGFFGAAAKRDVISDVFFGTDYHSHLGTRKKQECKGIYTISRIRRSEQNSNTFSKK